MTSSRRNTMLDMIQRTQTGSLVSPWWMMYHKSEEDFNAFRAWQPPTIRLMRHAWEGKDLMRDLHKALPHTLLTLRDVDLSHEHDYALGNPVAVGKEHATRMLDIFPHEADVPLGHVAFTGLNETRIDGDPLPGGGTAGDPERIAALVEYEYSRLTELQRHGARGIAGNLAVGWPPNDGPDRRVVWEPWEKLHPLLANGKGHFWGAHEYVRAQRKGEPHNPDFDHFSWGWESDRIGQNPWPDIQIIIGEWGISTYDGGTGWLHLAVDEMLYMLIMSTYDAQIRRDPRIVSFEWYCWDHDQRWKTFNIQPLRAKILDYVSAIRNSPRPEPAPVPRYPASVVNPLPPSGGVGDPTPTPTPDPFPDFTIGQGFQTALVQMDDEPTTDEIWFTGETEGEERKFSKLWGQRYIYEWNDQSNQISITRREA